VEGQRRGSGGAAEGQWRGSGGAVVTDRSGMAFMSTSHDTPDAFVISTKCPSKPA
jgi:hypothetical protein